MLLRSLAALGKNLILYSQTSLGKEKQVSYAPKERDMLNTTQWNDGKIQATPYGHFAHFVGKVRKHHRDVKGC